MIQYISYLGIVVVAYLISAIMGKFFVPFLHKIHFGQPIKTEFGPKWHEKKQGTPTMRGFLFITASIVASIAGLIFYLVTRDSGESNVGIYRMILCICYCLAFSFIGFLDDFIKVSKKHNLGLKAYQKVILQVVFSAIFLVVLYLTGDTDTSINLLFFEFDIGLFYYPLMIVVMIYLTNAVNLTDGVDGLCSSVTIVALLVYLCLTLETANETLDIFIIALVGGLLGFLFHWNKHPAKCFMGDTGSMFLGAAMTSIGIIYHNHLLLILVNIVYILEALSVVIQVSYFKYTAKKHFKATGEKGKGKRIFKMTPIHHHFELSGYSEEKIGLTFSSFGLIIGVIGIMLLRIFG